MAYGLKIYDENGNILFNISDLTGRLIYSEVVASGISDSTTISGFWPDRDYSTFTTLIDYISLWLYGDINPETYPGISDHYGVQWYCDNAGSDDYYTYWEENWDEPDWSFDEFIDWTEMTISGTVVSGTTVATVSGSNQTRWENLFNNSISGTHPYDSSISKNLTEIETNSHNLGFYINYYNTQYNYYKDYTFPVNSDDGYDMTDSLWNMYNNLKLQNKNLDTLFAYGSATLSDHWPHTVSLSNNGLDLVITYTAVTKTAGLGPPPTDYRRYMYSCDTLIYVVGYR